MSFKHPARDALKQTEEALQMETEKVEIVVLDTGIEETIDGPEVTCCMYNFAFFR
jgi:hypothetical protein